MVLTIKQEKFCLEYLKDGNASRAYREAYNTENAKDETIWNSAYKLMQNGEVEARIKELREKAEDDEIMSVRELKKFWSDVVRNKLIDDEPRLGDRLKASEMLGKTNALFTDKQEITGKLNIEVIDPFEN